MEDMEQKETADESSQDLTEKKLEEENKEVIDEPCDSEVAKEEKQENQEESLQEKNIAGLRFRRASKAEYFDVGKLELQLDDTVVAEIKQGSRIGKVIIAPKQIIASQVSGPLRRVLRKATPADIERSIEMGKKEEDALHKCHELILKLNLPMKCLIAESTLEGTHVTIHFTAPDKVDFRELVHELSPAIGMKIELRQVGPRDVSKLWGGLGPCGRSICCTSFLCELPPVSIKMAKEQGLSPDPVKISGMCGRLLCCLGYEHAQYRQMKAK